MNATSDAAYRRCSSPIVSPTSTAVPGGNAPARAAAQRDRVSPAPAQARHAVKALRVTGHEHEQQIRQQHAQPRERIEHLALLAAMRAGGDPDGPLAAPSGTQGARLLEQRRGQLDVELQIAGDVDQGIGRTEIAQALRVHARLRTKQIGVAEHRAGDPGHAQVAAQRGLRNAAVHEQQRNPPPAALGEDVRPKLRLGNDGDFGSHAIEEAPHGVR